MTTLAAERAVAVGDTVRVLVCYFHIPSHEDPLKPLVGTVDALYGGLVSLQVSGAWDGCVASAVVPYCPACHGEHSGTCPELTPTGVGA